MDRDDQGAFVLKPGELARIQSIAYERSGIDLRKGKDQMIAMRIGKHIRSSGLNSVRELLSLLEQDRTGAVLMNMIDALTTNHTHFMREPEHFEFLRKTVFPWMLNQGGLRIWCAASSTGEEPYTILFHLIEHRSGSGPISPMLLQEIEILATDISDRVILQAKRAVYPEDRLNGLPPGWLQRYFRRGEGKWAGHYQVKPAFVSRVRYQKFNLMDAVPASWRFPAIFCRNVMIYFDRPTQANVVCKMANALEPGGYLFVGHSESLNGIDHPLTYVRPAVYRKPDGSEPTPRMSGSQENSR